MSLRRSEQKPRHEHCFFEAASRGFQRKNGHEFTFPITDAVVPRSGYSGDTPRVAPCKCVGRADMHDLYLRIHFIFNWIYCEPSAEITFSFESSDLTFT